MMPQDKIYKEYCNLMLEQLNAATACKRPIFRLDVDLI